MKNPFPFHCRALGAMCAAGMCAAAAEETAMLDIPYHKTVLGNGLTLIVHEDHKTPIVAVNVWYHVGSKNERLGRTGFAHLFEHLMFNGSEHFNDDWFKAMERVGATGMNGTTGRDHTHYFQEVPRDALDFALWMESDRMGHLLGALTQERLDEQRGVVLNEKRQGDNQPYRIAWRLITQNAWPAGHPYSWEVIGSEEDLQAATLGDVRAWFSTWYGPANAVLVVAGDVTVGEAVEKVRRAFGDIPPGPPITHHTEYIAKRAGSRRMTAQDRVPQARLYKVWNIPPYGTTAGNQLSVVSGVLADGKTSRLYKRLVHDEQWATDVSAWADLGDIAGQFVVSATARQGVPLREVERAVDEELARFLADGPREEELRRVKIGFEADFVRGCERVGGFGGKSDVLAHNFVLTGDPGYYKTVQREIREATRPDVRDAARAWLSDGAFVLSVEPFPDYRVAPEGVDRSVLPVPDLKPEARLPEIQRATLANGLKVMLAERRDVPMVQMSLLVGGGYAADLGGVPGTASLTAAMLDEGTRRRSALEISEALDLLGARLWTGCGPDTLSVSLNALSRHLDEAMDIFSDIVLQPAFPEGDFERTLKHRLAAIRREKNDPNGVATRVLPKLVFEEGHPYAAPSSGIGDEAGVERLTRDALRQFHETWFRPENATLVAAGGVALDTLLPMLERHFGGWEASTRAIQRPPFNAGGREAGVRQSPIADRRLFLIDRPGAEQTVLFAGVEALGKVSPGEAAVDVMNTILGGSFTSRINMNLREDKHWSYGARSSLTDSARARVFLCSTAVQSDKTIDALRELAGEMRGIVADRPPTETERAKAATDLTLRLGGQWETLGAVAGVMEQMVRFDLPESYFRTYAETVRDVTLDAVKQAAVSVVQPEKLVWLVVGDRARLEPELRGLGWGPVTVLDADGFPAASDRDQP